MNQQQGIFKQAMGSNFDRLHPELQKRFGVGINEGYACVGKGVMLQVRRGPWWTIPFLAFGTIRNIMFPESGKNIPFQIDNYPYIDSYGRETVTFVRTMHVRKGRSRRFDATMIYSQKLNRVVDYLGSHQHLAVDLDLAVTENGALTLKSGNQRFYEGLVGFKFPMAFSGNAELTERFDDSKQVFVIEMNVRNKLLGFLFGYTGEFTCTYPNLDNVPVTVKPYREEIRE